jgi:hypothetical protein
MIDAAKADSLERLIKRHEVANSISKMIELMIVMRREPLAQSAEQLTLNQ